MVGLTDDELPGYALIHCETERALFHKNHIKRLFELAGDVPPTLDRDFYSCGPDTIRPLVERIRAKKLPQLTVIDGGLK